MTKATIPTYKQGFHCNNCGARVDFPERGLLPFDGRFCGRECSNEFDLKRAQWIMREREPQWTIAK